MIREGAMINLLGEVGYTGRAHYEGLEEVMGMPGVHIHLYGKKDTKPNRKMGHITVAQKNINDAKRVANEVKGKIRVITK